MVLLEAHLGLNPDNFHKGGVYDCQFLCTEKFFPYTNPNLHSVEDEYLGLFNIFIILLIDIVN